MLVLWTVVGTPLLGFSRQRMLDEGGQRRKKASCCCVDPILAHLQSKKDKDWARGTLEVVDTTGFSFFAECLKGQYTLGKTFAEYYSRQRALGKQFIGKDLFAECTLSGTRQRKVAVTASATMMTALSSILSATLGKVATFAECLDRGTRQSMFLCSS